MMKRLALFLALAGFPTITQTALLETALSYMAG